MRFCFDITVHHEGTPDPRLEHLIGLVGQVLSLVTNMEGKLAEIDTKIGELVTNVSSLTTVVASATAMIEGIQARIQTAVEAALAAGATPAQLQALTDLDNAMDAQTAALAKAVEAGTPAAKNR